jgi:NAD(P)-dependent dehydrogenase (short-subunit alcohol dehydrogenase family)
MKQLQDKIAWVTGAGTGIGEAAAEALAEAGATVVLTGRRLEPLEAVAGRIIESGGAAHVQPGDMTMPDSVRAIAEFIQSTFGRLDILVANAGAGAGHPGDLVLQLFHRIIPFSLR